MNEPIPAIFDSGVFRPLEPVNWPNGTRAEVTAASPATLGAVPAARQAIAWPASYFEQTAGALADEEFERPAQGDLPQRDDW